MGFFGGGRGDLGPPPDPFRFPERGRRFSANSGSRRLLGIGAATLVFFFALDAGKSIYVDLLWFQSVGFTGVFRTEIVARVSLFAAGAVIAALVLGVNVALARRLAPRAPEESFIEEVDPEAIRRVMTVLLIAGTGFIALIFGGSAGGAWQTVLSWLRVVPFGVKDPQFSRDASFYMF